MGPKKTQLSFDGAVRLGARVPLIGSVLILAALGFGAQRQWPWVDAALRDAPVATSADLTAGHRGPVRVVVDVVVPTTPAAPPDALNVVSSSQALVALPAQQVPSAGDAFWGQLRPMTPVERLRLPAGADASSNGVPALMLDTHGPSRTQLQLGVGVAALMALMATYLLVRSVGYAQRPLHSPAGRLLRRYGDPARVRASFDEAISRDHAVAGRLHAPEGFIAFRNRRGFAVIPRADVMWVRESVQPDPRFLSVLSFPFVLLHGLTSRGMYVYERSGARLRIPLASGKERRAVMRELESLCAHSIFVDDPATRKYWRKHRQHFVAAVDERRAVIESYRATSFEAPVVDIRTAWGLARDEYDVIDARHDAVLSQAG
jgi:hypothetical protein